MTTSDDMHDSPVTQGAATWKCELSPTAEPLWYVRLDGGFPPPYRHQRHVEAILDLGDDGTLAGIELIDNAPMPPDSPVTPAPVGEVDAQSLKRSFYERFGNPLRPPLRHELEEYWVSLDGKTGELGYQWSDKPHRHVFDLLGEIVRLRAELQKAPPSDTSGEAVAWRIRERPGFTWQFTDYDPERMRNVRDWEHEPLYPASALAAAEARAATLQAALEKIQTISLDEDIDDRDILESIFETACEALSPAHKGSEK